MSGTQQLRLPTAASALALVLAFSGTTFAADDSSDTTPKKVEKKSELEEVIVTGLRASLQSAQSIKQNAEQVVDSITAQDIGALPDRSVSEALQRIPGVTLQRTNEAHDPARLASEGGGVFIRGLSWVRSEYNGRDIFSANNGRALSFEDVSADLLAGVDVYKNPSAEMIEGGIGGLVNLRTRLPFDSDKRIIAISGDANYADLLNETFLSYNGLYSDTWDTGIGRIGFLGSYSQGEIGNRTDSVQTGAYNLAGGNYMPNSFGWRRIDWHQERVSMMAALQWEPTDGLVFTLQGTQARANPHDIEHALGDTDGGYATSDPSYHYDSDHAITSGTISNIKPTADTRYGYSNKVTDDYSLNMKWAINQNWTVSADAQYVKSHADVVSMTAFSQNGSQPLGTLQFDIGGDTPHLNLTSANQTAQAPYWWAAAMDHIEDNDANEKAGRLDTEYTFDDNPWLKSFRIGARATDKTATTRQTGYNWNLLSNQFWGNGGGVPVQLNQTGFGTSRDPNLPFASQHVDYNNFFRGDVHLPGTAWFPSVALVSGSRADAYNLLKNTESSGWGWVPLTNDSYDTSTPKADNVSGGVNDQGEKTYAGFAVLRFEHGAGFLGTMDGNIGVRVVKTEAESAGIGTIAPTVPQGGAPGNCVPVPDPNGHPNASDCAAYAQAYAFAVAAAANPLSSVDGSNTYTDTLPSLNVRFKLTDTLQWRLAAAKAISRPSFSQMVAFTTLSFNFNGYVPQPGGVATGSGGNPNLKPVHANQYDMSLEWYFAPTGSLSGAVFYKDISDYIFIGHTAETYTVGGQTATFDVTAQTNGNKGKVQGFELAYQQFYDSLPGALSGLGFQANYTYVDSSGGANTALNPFDPNQTGNAANTELPLEGMSMHSYNAALIYEKYGVSARLAYNWRDRYLLTTSAANLNRPVWSESYGQLDGSVFYTINQYVKIGLQASNLLNSRTFLDVSNADNVNIAPRYSWTDTDRRIALALRMTF
jgi:TonB-dependent receptor